jgi:hypothetical protein
MKNLPMLLRSTILFQRVSSCYPQKRMDLIHAMFHDENPQR